jgi:hypothetical protein
VSVLLRQAHGFEGFLHARIQLHPDSHSVPERPHFQEGAVVGLGAVARQVEAAPVRIPAHSQENRSGAEADDGSRTRDLGLGSQGTSACQSQSRPK